MGRKLWFWLWLFLVWQAKTVIPGKENKRDDTLAVKAYAVRFLKHNNFNVSDNKTEEPLIPDRVSDMGILGEDSLIEVWNLNRISWCPLHHSFILLSLLFLSIPHFSSACNMIVMGSKLYTWMPSRISLEMINVWLTYILILTFRRISSIQSLLGPWRPIDSQ